MVLFGKGTEQLLIEGTQLEQIALNVESGKALPAWRFVIESGVKPDGTTIELPGGLLARTTASLSAVELFVPTNILTVAPPKPISVDDDFITNSVERRGEPLKKGITYEVASQLAKQRMLIANVPVEIISESTAKDDHGNIARVQFRNKTDRAIQAYTVIFYLFNDFGDWVDHERGIAQEQNVKAGRTENAAWKHYENATKVVFEVQRILFRDGSEWNLAEGG